VVHSHILYNLALRSKKICYHSLIWNYRVWLLRIIFRANAMKLMRSFLAQYSIISNLLLLVVLVLIRCLQPNACLAMEPNGPCYTTNQTPKDRQCAIGIARVPMNPSASIGTNCSAPTIVFPISKLATLKQLKEAPVTKRPCGLAPITCQPSSNCYVEQSYKIAPYFNANTCQKAPIIISYPSKQEWNNCK
jgi:hypothetical protein